MKIKTPSDLKHALSQTNPDSNFFSRHTMKFFGDTMKNYSLRQPKDVIDFTGKVVYAYELVRKSPVKNGLKKSAWFQADNLDLIFAMDYNNYVEKCSTHLDIAFGIH